MHTRATLGHYEIVSAIGKGGMGEVWRARDTTSVPPINMILNWPQLLNEN